LLLATAHALQLALRGYRCFGYPKPKPINYFLNGTFESFHRPYHPVGRKRTSPRGWWHALSKQEKQKLSTLHSMFPFLFPETESESEQWELMLLEDCPVDEISVPRRATLH
jgi:hypothetical protein